MDNIRNFKKYGIDNSVLKDELYLSAEEEIHALHKNISSFIYLIFSNALYKFNEDAKIIRVNVEESFLREDSLAYRLDPNQGILLEYNNDESVEYMYSSDVNFFTKDFNQLNALTEHNIINYFDI